MDKLERRNFCTFFGDRYRYFILILGWFCLTSISANMIALNFTLICMVPQDTQEGVIHIPQNSTHSTYEVDENGIPHFNYSTTDKAVMMWSAAIGSMIGTFPFSFLYTRWGARYVLFGAGMLSAASTALIPLGTTLGMSYFTALRFVQGIAYSADFAAMGVLCSRWASFKQNAFFISVLTCYSALSSSLTNSISGVICESRFGWPMVYYAHALISLILFLLWFYFYTDHPRSNIFVSDIELEKINRDKSIAHINMDKFVPYKAILSTRLVWVVWINAFADLFSGIFLVLYQPLYVKYVLKYSVEETGFIASIPSISHIPMKFVFGYSSDKFKCLPERQKMILFNFFAVAVPGILYAIVGFVPADNPIVVVMIFCLMHMVFATAGGGFYKCATLCSRQYSYFVVANIQFVKCFVLFLGPALMAVFVPNESDQTQWRKIFIILAVALFAAQLLFTFEATDKPAEFTNITSETVKRDKLRKETM